MNQETLPDNWPPLPGDVWRVGNEIWTAQRWTYGGIAMHLANVGDGAGCVPEDALLGKVWLGEMAIPQLLYRAALAPAAADAGQA